VPLFYQQNINETTRLGVWKITETEDFFLQKVPLQRNISHPHKRLQHLAGRYLLRQLFPDFPYEEIAIADTRKPYLPDEQYHFSISHCGDYAAALVSSQYRVGIDIEIMTPRIHRIKEKFLHPAELSFVHQATDAMQVPMLTLLWSVKEAMYKWWGLGAVDFSEELRIKHFQWTNIGALETNLLKNNSNIPLNAAFQLTDGMSMAWIVN
jgi:phosphopantetheinyl transferase